ncbi:hypothetical protein GS3922_00770 [Geobacillus subterraneus]|uniref:Thioredoxin domain-containing protein n=3 Tax=Anoxybacillaceae TaxID=3120669 RepID=A0ABN4NHS2_9BACL|nr:hypothetical protein GS3922_00770 [Geobacillus subterraneus]KZS26670.1 hypothetical protein A5418_04495 [Geobacillus subterraneus]OXB91371.1 hypothetical protein B9L21_00550 [Geobacillus uzenensis]
MGSDPFGGVLLLITVLAVGWLSVNKTATREDTIHIRVKDIEGNTVNINDQKPTVLFFMAAWCVSCVDIEQNLKEVAKERNVQVVTVDVDPQTDAKEDLAAFQRTYGEDWPHVFDADLSLVKLFRVNSLDGVAGCCSLPQTGGISLRTRRFAQNALLEGCQ